MATNNSVALDTTKKAIKTAIRVKFGVLTLKVKLIIGGIALAAVLLIIFITGLVGVIQGIVGGSSSKSNSITGFGTAQVSAQVEQYRGAISSELSKYGRDEYTELLLALMMQESGGMGNDPMQASESKCGYIGCIASPSESIEYGVKHFISVLERSNYDIKLTLQSYNFGGGFIDFVMDNGGTYTKELAITFSQNMYDELKHLGIYKCHRASAIEHQACYGDIEYVDAVLRYLPSAVMGGPSQQISASGFSSPVNNSLQVTSGWGWRTIFGQQEFHQGIDFACNETNSIHSVQDGEVVYAGAMGTYGKLVQVRHGEFISAYAHLSKINVKVGDSVSSGQSVGMCGTTGRSTGTHLHFELKTQMWGGQFDPTSYLGL